MIKMTFPSYIPNVGFEFATYIYHYGPHHYRDFKDNNDTQDFRNEIAEQLYAQMMGWA